MGLFDTGGGNDKLNDVIARLKRIEDKLDRLLSSQGVEADPEGARGPLEAEILRMMRQNSKIQAIKYHRKKTGMGLKESKEAVEALWRRHGPQ